MSKARRQPEAFIDGHLLSPESLMMSYDFDPERSEGSVKPPLFLTSTFSKKTARELAELFRSFQGGRGVEKAKISDSLVYSRANNPNVQIFEKRLSLWDGADDAAVFSSGMAAISTVSLAFLRPGDVLLHSEPLYGGTEIFFKEELRNFGIKTSSFPAGSSYTTISRAAKIACQNGPLAMVYIEPLANPTNVFIDSQACARLADAFSVKKRKTIFVADNTYLGPLWHNPLKYGADIVIYSATKYLGGHSDIIAGAASGNAGIVAELKNIRTRLGTIASPFTCWLLTRSLETLKLRMTSQMKNARYVAKFLRDHPKTAKVYYPGFLDSSSDQYRVYEQQCSAPGAMVSFDIKGGKRAAFKFLDALRFFKLAVSLGGTEPLASHPATTTHSGISEADRLRMGITDSMIRLSVGLGSPDDYYVDLRQALNGA